MYRKKGAWSLTGTRLPGKFGLLARVLVNTMALTNVRILHVCWDIIVDSCNWTLKVGWGLLPMHCVPNILEGLPPV
jgi:hypothetical protein